jgi:plastocyanin
VNIRRLGLVAVAALVVLVPSSVAASPTAEVSIEFADYRPSQLDVLPGENVIWTNVSQRTHTVTSDTGLFDSDQVPGGAHFAVQFKDVGTYRYHCTIHPSIVGEIDVRRVILGLLPTAAVPVGARVEFDGRTADPTQSVGIQRRLDGSTSFTTVATATPDPDGNWKTTLVAEATGDYRATSGPDVSQTRRLLVGVRRVLVHAARVGVSVTVAPSAPYARFVVEVHLRERFGWWPVSSGVVNYVSQAEVRVPRPARVRVVLVDKDGWTPIATSRVVVLDKR